MGMGSGGVPQRTNRGTFHVPSFSKTKAFRLTASPAARGKGSKEKRGEAIKQLLEFFRGGGYSKIPKERRVTRYMLARELLRIKAVTTLRSEISVVSILQYLKKHYPRVVPKLPKKQTGNPQWIAKAKQKKMAAKRANARGQAAKRKRKK
jgi:hypothetical protein